MHSFEIVEVQSTLTGVWTPGFQVTSTERTDGGSEVVRLRRLSDGSALPMPISAARVRPAQPSSS